MGRIDRQSLLNVIRREVKALLSLQATARPWQLPVAAAISSGAPMAAGAVIGEMTAGALGAIAGLSVLYLPPVPLRQRVPLIIGCALAMLASFAIGSMVAGYTLAAILMISCVAGAAMMFCKAKLLVPPGPLFMVMACAIAAFAPLGAGSVGESVGYFAIGCLWACIVAVAYSIYIVRRHIPQQASPPTTAELRVSARDSVLTAVFVGTSLALAALLALDKPYWVPVSCLAVMQGLTLRASWNRNVHRMAGTAIGLILTALIMPLMDSSWVIVATVVALTYLIEIAVVRHYALAAIFITPLTIILAESNAVGQESTGALMNARLVDTVVGALIGLIGAVCLHHEKVRGVIDRTLFRRG